MTGGPKFKMPRGASGGRRSRASWRRVRLAPLRRAHGEARRRPRGLSPSPRPTFPSWRSTASPTAACTSPRARTAGAGRSRRRGSSARRGLTALRRLDPGVAKKLRELKDAEVSASSSSRRRRRRRRCRRRRRRRRAASHHPGAIRPRRRASRGAVSDEGGEGIGRGREEENAPSSSSSRAATASRGPGRSSRSGAGRRSRTSCDGYGRKTRRGSVDWSAGLAIRPESGDGGRRRAG